MGNSQINREEYFNKIFNNSNDAIVIIDLLNDKIIDANPKASRLLGYSKEELLSIGVSTIHQDEMERFRAFSKKVLKEGEGWTNELTCLTKCGKPLPSEISASVLDKDESIKMIVMIRDISERKLSEEKIKKYVTELEELNATKNRFFSIIAHDLKNPFQGLLAFSSYLKNEIDELTNEEIHEFSEGIYETADQLFSLLNNLLTWSMVQIGNIDYKPVILNLHEIVNEVIDILKINALKKNISIHNGMNKHTIIFADRNMMSSIFRNLISNAIKFTGQGGKVEIFSNEKDDFFEIDISDTGVGMDDKRLGEIFRIGYHVSTKGTDKEQGTGLGLILVKEFVEKNGGSIRAFSKLNHGTNFRFTVPKYKNQTL